jgi:6-pyruvoyl-tetrahydropterin synthase
MRCKLPIDNPSVAAEWDYWLNAPLLPDDYSGGSEKYVWWKCKTCYNRWQAKIYTRTEGRGCPVCAKDRLKQGVNDLATLYPVVANEWDYFQNEPHLPSDFTADSTDKVWWTCKHGHSWQAKINKRTKRKQKCPYCSNNKVWQGYNDIPTTHPQLVPEWDDEENCALRPEQFTAGADAIVGWKCECGYRWKARIYTRKKHGCPCCARNILVVGKNDLATLNPNVAAQWDHVKNGAITPKDVAANKNGFAWWVCEKGHSWQAVIYSRNRGRECPYCTGRAVLVGFNDLATLRPDIAKQFNVSRNHGMTPQQVTVFSHRKVWWTCSHGHNWKTSVANRSNGTNCPVCENKVVVPGFNDLKKLRPDLAEQWDDTKNKGLTPEQVTLGSNRKVWWTCSRGHSWQAAVVARVHGTKCPYCTGKRPIVGETDFATVHPELLKEWDYTRNKKLKPQDITAASHKKVWWKCPEGHRWKTSAYHRHAGNNCPVCGKLKDKHIVVAGVNDLATCFPEIADEWDHDKNKKLTAWQVLPCSNRKVGWKCRKCGHRWDASVQARRYGTLCPKCYGKIHTRTRFIM